MRGAAGVVQDRSDKQARPATPATRNVKHFQDLNVPVIDP
jgi:hypothetical protein